MRRPKYDTRCFWFEEDGRPKTNTKGKAGCYRGEQCYFVHPSDQEWTTAVPSKPPKERRGRDWYRSPTPPRSPCPRSPRPRSPDPSYRRDSGQVEGSRERERQLERRTSIDSSNASVRRGLPGSPSGSTPSLEPRSQVRRAADTKVSDTASASHMPPPPLPTPSTSAAPPSAIPPPLPSPSAPTSTTVGPVPRKPGLGIDERQEIWRNRIKLMADCIVARTDHAKLQRELSQYEALLQSWRFSSLADGDKDRLRAQVTEVRDRCATKKADLNELIKSLINADYWPAPKDTPGLDKVRKEVAELKELCASVQKDVMEVLAKQAQINLAATSASVTVDNSSSMDVDGDNSQHKGKRRRLSEGGRDDRPTFVSRRVHEQVRWLEERLADLENILIQRDGEVLDELDIRVEAKVEEMKQCRSEFAESERVKAHEALGENIESLEKNLNTTGDEVGQLAEEIATLITESGELKKENEWLRGENEEWKRKYAELQATHQRANHVIERQTREIDALSAAMANQSARTTAIPPQIPPLDRLEQVVQEPVLQLVYEMLQSQAEELKKSLGSNILQQNTNIYSAIFPKLSKILQVVEGLAKAANGGQNLPLTDLNV
ncbi:hypothetical protein OE88DRAFT_968211 [Heliocybe sulcata]|uniref:C3H1-type domain-containing protein n=1 Tax=Heliocybe sulcata TaxID=5364 RepID=A0A5C3ND97_9AGAM|nr:hypothetical protein OE88DRAFT_968211 [Heliocybe sulcata]